MRELDRSHLSQSKSRAWRASRRLKKRHLGRPCRFSHYELCRPSWLSSAENLKNALCSFVILWHSLQIPFGSDPIDVKTNSGSLFEVWTSRLTVLLKMTGSPGQTRPLMWIDMSKRSLSWYSFKCCLVFGDTGPVEGTTCWYLEELGRGWYWLLLGGTGSV